MASKSFMCSSFCSYMIYKIFLFLTPLRLFRLCAMNYPCSIRQLRETMVTNRITRKRARNILQYTMYNSITFAETFHQHGGARGRHHAITENGFITCDEHQEQFYNHLNCQSLQSFLSNMQILNRF